MLEKAIQRCSVHHSLERDQRLLLLQIRLQRQRHLNTQQHGVCVVLSQCVERAAGVALRQEEGEGAPESRWEEQVVCESLTRRTLTAKLVGLVLEPVGVEGGGE